MSQDVTRSDVTVESLMDPPDAAPPSNHGRTAAAWTFFWIAVVATAVIAVAVALNSWTVATIGLIGCGVAIVVSLIMRALGLGQRRTQ